MSLFGIGPLPRVSDAEYLQKLKNTAAHLEQTVSLYRQDKRPAWMIRDAESSLAATRRAISALEATLLLVPKPTPG